MTADGMISEAAAKAQAKRNALSSIERNGPGSVLAAFLNKVYGLGLDNRLSKGES